MPMISTLSQKLSYESAHLSSTFPLSMPRGEVHAFDEATLHRLSIADLALMLLVCGCYTKCLKLLR